MKFSYIPLLISICILMSCVGMIQSNRVRQVRMSNHQGLNTKEDFIENYGTPDKEYLSVSKDPCIAYVGFWGDYAQFCFDRASGINISQGGGSEFHLPDTSEIFSSDTSKPMFFKHYEKKFQLQALKRNQVRVFVIPSFEKELVFTFATDTDSIQVLMPKDSSLWSEMQQKTNYGGRVLDPEEMNGPPNLNQINLIVGTHSEATALIQYLKHFLKKPRRAIKKKALFFDGTFFIYESNIDNKYQLFEMRNIPWYSLEYDTLNTLTSQMYKSFTFEE